MSSHSMFFLYFSIYSVFFVFLSFCALLPLTKNTVCQVNVDVENLVSANNCHCLFCPMSHEKHLEPPQATKRCLSTRVMETPEMRNSSSGGGGGGLQSGVGVVRLIGPSLPRTSRAGSTEAYSEDIEGGKEETKSVSRGALKVGRLASASADRLQDGQASRWQDPHQGFKSPHWTLNPAPFASWHLYSTLLWEFVTGEIPSRAFNFSALPWSPPVLWHWGALAGTGKPPPFSDRLSRAP